MLDARDDISDAYLSIGGYQIICRRDGRDTAGGRGRGLLVYVKEGIPAAELVLGGGDLVTECCGVTIPWERGGGNQVGAGLQTTEDSRQPSRWWEHREAMQPSQEPRGEGGSTW